MRTSNASIRGSLVFEIQRSFNQLNANREELSSGKRINRWADDAPGVGAVLRYRGLERNNAQYLRNSTTARGYLETTDSTLQSMAETMSQLRSLTVRELGPLGGDKTRGAAIAEVEALRNSILNLANTKLQGSYLFAGHETGRSPFEYATTGTTYHGDGNPQQVKIGPGTLLDVTVPGDRLLGPDSAMLGGSNDLSPRLQPSDLLAELKDGDGVNLGRFELEGPTGTTVVVDLSTATDLQDVINRIGATGQGITARISDDEQGLLLESSGEIIVRALPGDSTAADLSILGTTTNGSLEGGDIRRRLSDTTPLADMVALDGSLPLGVLRFELSSGQVEIDLSGATNLSDVRSLISGVIPEMDVNVDLGTLALTLNGGESFSLGSPDGDLTARNLGLVGSASPARVFDVFDEISTALRDGDMDRLRQALTEVDAARAHIMEIDVGVGARNQQLDRSEYLLQERAVGLARQRSSYEESDILDAASRLSSSEVAYQAALQTSARLFQISLLNYL